MAAIIGQVVKEYDEDEEDEEKEGKEEELSVKTAKSRSRSIIFEMDLWSKEEYWNFMWVH